MISKKNYKKYVTERPLQVGDLIGHDGCEPFYVYDGKDFLQIFRDGNNGGKLTVDRNFHNNLDWYEASFYRFSYMGNVKDGVHLRTYKWKNKDGSPFGGDYNKAELKEVKLELIPSTLDEMVRTTA
jgi:hypothetical protein